MASSALLKVRFPDGTIRYGRYGATADVPYEALTEDIDQWDTVPLEPEGPVPAGEPVPVEIGCDYGYGFWWPGTALPDRLVDSGVEYKDWDEIRTPHVQGYPDWWGDDGYPA